MVIRIAHALGADGAKERLQRAIAGLPASPYHRVISIQRADWHGSTLHVAALALGEVWSSTIEISNDEVTIAFDLPMYLWPSQAAIEASVRTVAAEVISG